MWQQISSCSESARVAFCIPWFSSTGTLPIYWYGILAATGIFVASFYAAKHVEAEGQNPDIVWDALLWVLLAGLIGARLWYVAADVLGGSTAFSLARPLDIINPRLGGMNIFGGVAAGAVVLYFYARKKKIDGWLVADGAMMGLLLGQAIGRFGNLINQELYGPPTSSNWWGILIRPENRLPQYQTLPLDTRFQPTMLYEAAWLIATFAVLYFLFRRYQARMVHGVLAGSYLILAGIGRFVVEAWRPDQPGFLLQNGMVFSFSRVLSVGYIVVGLIILLDRLNYIRIPFIARPLSPRQRLQEYEGIVHQKQQRKRIQERDKARAERQKQRATAKPEDR